ncbi:(2Fe-2S) ferredoxin domain-containing protein [Denitratisoma oestradiolicum]|uniref:2Fe-2S ferredoxin n=1 Tax=Denitratisoma oestradiolicum TaxID=311182 RepID=A0A6S6XWP3_9PROT|nr:NAD(P)H-dependent oxidoreductase subunit E [Denitratisoma oestradiolicum]TWO80893.1 2Fe-2S ferredoxin [Denitratisoma oestradiolicum]CAB1367342.1 2Fe-2S ferredoxin [Denitratisoma oestradiolicum]
MSFYERHIFFCVNERDEGQMCCNASGGGKMLNYAKDKIKALQADGPGKVRVNKAGCLGRCDKGPVAVVYPEGVWYSFVDEEDIDEIVDSHLIKGEVVERLKV